MVALSSPGPRRERTIPDFGIYAQRYGVDGKPAGREFQVNTVAALDQSHPKVAGLSGGGFVIVWTCSPARRRLRDLRAAL